MKHRHLLTLLIVIALANVQQAHAQDAPAPAAPSAAASAAAAPSAAASQDAEKASAAPGTASVAATTPVPQPTTPVFDASALGDSREKASADAPVIGLEEAIALTLRNNPQRTAARAALVAAQSRVGSARSEGGLQVGLNGSAALNDNYGRAGTGGGNVGVTNNRSSQSASVDATLPVYTGGRVKASTRAAQSAAQAQAALTLQTEQDLVLSSTNAYLNVLRNAQLLQVADSNLEVSRERQRISQLRYEAGAAPRLDVFTANTTLADAVQRRIAASNNAALAKANLNILIGRPAETGLQVESIESLELRVPLPADVSKAPVSTDAELRALAEQSRPLLASSRANEVTASENIKVVRAQRKPSLGLSLSALVRNPASILGRFALTLGLSVAQNLFDSGRSRSQIDEAEAILLQNRANTDIQRLNVSAQIEESLLALDTAQGSLASADAAVSEAQAALAAAQLGYQAGARTAIDVSDAQASLLTTQTNAVNARFDVAANQAALSSAVGILTSEGQAAYQQVLQEELKNPVVNGVQVKGEPKRKKFLGIF